MNPEIILHHTTWAARGEQLATVLEEVLDLHQPRDTTRGTFDQNDNQIWVKTCQGCNRRWEPNEGCKTRRLILRLLEEAAR